MKNLEIFVNKLVVCIKVETNEAFSAKKERGKLELIYHCTSLNLLVFYHTHHKAVHDVPFRTHIKDKRVCVSHLKTRRKKTQLNNVCLFQFSPYHIDRCILERDKDLFRAKKLLLKAQNITSRKKKW